ncbi:peptide ABC transporter substrate-binding protein [Microvirga splendida]|uniref:Peptide ABC transporter substrate-binding protein n=1 Tax=Microvirga splendida TaxID=2795727 RepID=A0ABS0Y109_9HYPH|nr:peptide ABC transporter substrate-binding protein [Microvirga splendida]MBJ6125992.1 peptide ABC transporter substrate-binding protein [Microvirga splendida]
MSSWLKRTTIAAFATVAFTGMAAAQVVYNRGNDADPETLDPHKTSTTYESHILRDMLEGLMAYNAAGKVVPGVAEKHEISDDGMTYRFTLRPNAKWSNGDPLKASDFVFSLRRIMDPATGAKYANILYPIKNAEKINKGQGKVEDLGVKAVDDRTLEITLEQPTPYFLELLTHQTGLPVHAASIQKHGADFVKPGNYVSNGPYVLKDFVPNSQITLEKNANFHDAQNVKIDRVVFQPQKDLAATARRFEAGELLSTSDFPADQAKALRERLGNQVRTSPRLGLYYIALNTTKENLKDPRVRQALSMVIDRELISEQVWGGAMLPAYSIVPPGIGNYKEPATVDFKDMSPIEREDKAKELLKQAGYGPGKPLKVQLRYNTTDNNKNTVVQVADDWKRIGVETSFINTDGKTHFAVLRDTNDYEAARAGWIADYSDPQNFLFILESDNKGFNYAKYNNPEYDALMDKAAKEQNLDKRADILKQAEAIALKDMPYIPVLFYGNNNLVSNKLQGWVDNPTGFHPTRYMSIKQ